MYAASTVYSNSDTRHGAVVNPGLGPYKWVMGINGMVSLLRPDTLAAACVSEEPQE